MPDTAEVVLHPSLSWDGRALLASMLAKPPSETKRVLIINWPEGEDLSAELSFAGLSVTDLCYFHRALGMIIDERIKGE